MQRFFFYVFFVILSLPLSSTRWFAQHFQASVHFPLTSAIDKSQQHQNNFLGIKPGAARMQPLRYAVHSFLNCYLLAQVTLVEPDSIRPFLCFLY